MEPKETKEKNRIRYHVNRYDLLGSVDDLITAQELIHRELLRIITLHNPKLCYNNTKEEKCYEKSEQSDKRVH